MREIDEKLKTLPDRSGVYIMKDACGKVIYVGKAKVLKNRVRQYFRGHNHAPKVAKMIENIADFEYIITDSEKEALILENNLIKENQPKYNILLKDDKTYPFIKVTLGQDFPKVMITRRVIRDGARYFGPYCSNFSLKELLALINEVFSVRVCNKNITENKLEQRPCLYHQLGKCSAPCCGKISKEAYRKNIDNVISFLNGKYDKAISIINEKMKIAASQLDFETAAKWRDCIAAVSLLEDNQKIVSAT
ncbi:MAG: excinuclease ABC subunit C, partial [Clostridia bacterium]|nr:excinuclease ABC subunit C [Clostridia bacterium]